MFKMPFQKKTFFLSIIGLSLALASQFVNSADKASSPTVTVPSDVKQWLDTNNVKAILIPDATGIAKPFDSNGKQLLQFFPNQGKSKKNKPSALSAGGGCFNSPWGRICP